MGTLWRLALALVCGALLVPATAASCGIEQPCRVAAGEYRIRMPQGMHRREPVGAVMYFHGLRGSAEAVMANAALEKAVDGLGLALIAPHGAGGTWSYPGSPYAHRDEFRFVAEVLDDVVARFAVDPARIMAAGFSMGGSMVWNLACNMATRFLGFAPIAGAFWDPLPSHCPSALPRLIHVHGMSDRVVPYDGRELASGHRQGDVGRSIDVWMVQGACEARAPSRDAIEAVMKRVPGDVMGEAVADDGAALDCARRYACGPGLIELCVHAGGHRVRAEWVVQAWAWLQALSAAERP